MSDSVVYYILGIFSSYLFGGLVSIINVLTEKSIQMRKERKQK